MSGLPEYYLIDLLTPEILLASWLAAPFGEVANEGEGVPSVKSISPEQFQFFQRPLKSREEGIVF